MRVYVVESYCMGKTQGGEFFKKKENLIEWIIDNCQYSRDWLFREKHRRNTGEFIEDLKSPDKMTEQDLITVKCEDDSEIFFDKEEYYKNGKINNFASGYLVYKYDQADGNYTFD